MKKKFSVREIVVPTAVLLLIGAVSAFLLGWTDSLTRDKIAALEEETREKAMQTVMPEAARFGDTVTVDGDVSYTPALGADGAVIGYAFTVSANGYGGEIRVMTGIAPDGTVAKVVVLSADNETPGLGQNVKKDSFLDRFIGKSGTLSVVKNAPAADSQVQAVTSATISSTAVTRAVNTATTYYMEYIAQGGNR